MDPLNRHLSLHWQPAGEVEIRAAGDEQTGLGLYEQFGYIARRKPVRIVGRDRSDVSGLALSRTAGQGLEADPCDPAAHWVMGRALWLRREHDGAVGALDQSIRLSPNFALAHYALAFVRCQTGDPARAIDAADIAARLSPLDPMLFAINGTRTFASLRLGRVDEAAEFAIRVGQQSNAHVHAHAIAALDYLRLPGEWRKPTLNADASAPYRDIGVLDLPRLPQGVVANPNADLPMNAGSNDQAE